MDPLILAGIVVVGLAVLFAIFKLMWRVAEPNEALIISGLREHAVPDAVGESLGFKIVTGKGTLVIPGVQTVRRLSLDLREAELRIDCVTHQGIPLGIQGVVIFKVGDDLRLDRQRRPPLPRPAGPDGPPGAQRVRRPPARHRRQHDGRGDDPRPREAHPAHPRVVGHRDGEARPHRRLAPDPGDRRPHRLHQEPGPAPRRRRGQPRPASPRPHADREATEREQEADALKAEARRDSQIKQAGYQAEIDQAAAKAQQAGPLAEARPARRSSSQETKVAELEAQREEQRLQATVRKPADAKAYEQVTLAKADRDARIAAGRGPAPGGRAARQAPTAERVKLEAAAEAEHVRLDAIARAESTRPSARPRRPPPQAKGLAEGEAVRAKGMAEAEAIKARADALAENQDAVIGQQLAEKWPAIVEAAAKPFGDIDQMIVLNGAQGLSEALAQALQPGRGRPPAGPQPAGRRQRRRDRQGRARRPRRPQAARAAPGDRTP